MTALFPNPGNILRPGQYAIVRAVTGEDKGALLVPQPAVSELQGGYEVVVLGGDNKVAMRPVQVGNGWERCGHYQWTGARRPCRGRGSTEASVRHAGSAAAIPLG